MKKVLRMFKSYLARKKRKETKEIVQTLEKRKRADARNNRKKKQKLKSQQPSLGGKAISLEYLHLIMSNFAGCIETQHPQQETLNEH